MAETEALNREQTYLKLATAHAQLKGLGAKGQPNMPTIRYGTRQYDQWAAYFDHLGFSPWALRRLQWDQSQEMTVPAEWPSQFDAGFRA